jgi:hypothetical protein
MNYIYVVLVQDDESYVHGVYDSSTQADFVAYNINTNAGQTIARVFEEEIQ